MQRPFLLRVGFFLIGLAIVFSFQNCGDHSIRSRDTEGPVVLSESIEQNINLVQMPATSVVDPGLALPSNPVLAPANSNYVDQISASEFLGPYSPLGVGFYNIFRGPVARPNLIEPIIFQKFAGGRLMVTPGNFGCMNWRSYRGSNAGGNEYLVGNITCSNYIPNLWTRFMPNYPGLANGASYTYLGLPAFAKAGVNGEVRCSAMAGGSETTNSSELVAIAICEVLSPTSETLSAIRAIYGTFQGGEVVFSMRDLPYPYTTNTIQNAGTVTFPNLKFECRAGIDPTYKGAIPGVQYVTCIARGPVAVRLQ